MRLTGGRGVLQVHPTRRCNLSCLHCYSDSGPGEREEIPLPVLADLISDAAELGYEVLAISGGEPFLYAPLPELLQLARSAGLQCLLTSNGTLASRRRLHQLAGCLDLLVLSLDGPPAEHDRMRARDGAHAAMMRRVGPIQEAGLPFGFLFTLTQHNVHQLEWAARLAADSGATLLQVHPLEPAGRGRAMTGEIPDAVEMSYALLEVARLRRVFRGALRFQADLAVTAALAAVLREPAPVGSRPAGRALLPSPLVVEPDGWCVPLQYGFPRQFALGSLHEAPLTQLAGRWADGAGAALGDLARTVGQQLSEPGAPPVSNGYELLAQAAALVPTGAGGP